MHLIVKLILPLSWLICLVFITVRYYFKLIDAQDKQDSVQVRNLLNSLSKIYFLVSLGCGLLGWILAKFLIETK